MNIEKENVLINEITLYESFVQKIQAPLNPADIKHPKYRSVNQTKDYKEWNKIRTETFQQTHKSKTTNMRHDEKQRCRNRQKTDVWMNGSESSDVI